MSWPSPYGAAAAGSNTTSQLVGAGVTSSVLYMRKLPPQPCGHAVVLAVHDVVRRVLQERRDVREAGDGRVSISATSPAAIRRSDASPDAETPS